jgi:hypothetical protein
MVDLLVLTSLEKLLLKTKILLMCFTKQAILMRRSTLLSLPLQLVFPGVTYGFLCRPGPDLIKKISRPNKQERLTRASIFTVVFIFFVCYSQYFNRPNTFFKLN